MGSLSAADAGSALLIVAIVMLWYIGYKVDGILRELERHRNIASSIGATLLQIHNAPAIQTPNDRDRLSSELGAIESEIRKLRDAISYRR